MSEDDETIVWCNGGPHDGTKLVWRGRLPHRIRLAIRSGSVLGGWPEDCDMHMAEYDQYRDTKRYDWVKP